MMKLSLGLARAIDSLNDRVGKLTYWLVLVAVLDQRRQRGHALSVRSELQRLARDPVVLFSAVFLLCAGYTLLHNQHIRIDIVSGRFSQARAGLDRHLRHAFLSAADGHHMLWLSWPVFMNAYRSNEMSCNAGGLVRWPARLLMPVGFLLLVLQGVSELIKRIAFLRGLIPDPSERTPAERRGAARRGLRERRRSSAMSEFITTTWRRSCSWRLWCSCCSAIRSRSRWPRTALLRLIGIELGLLHPSLFQALPSASSASCPTTRCSRFRSSPSWG